MPAPRSRNGDRSRARPLPPPAGATEISSTTTITGEGFRPRREWETNGDEVHKNTRGDLGPICNSCGGYGYTNLITGGSGNCARCQGTGIQPPDLHALAARVALLEGQVAGLERQLARRRR